MKVALLSMLVSSLAMPAAAQTEYDAKNPPRFEDFPITETWNQARATLKLSTGSERMFKTRLMSAAKEPPNFAGHYRIAYWGCGSDALPLAKPNGTGWDKWIMCTASFEGTGDELHIEAG